MLDALLLSLIPSLAPLNETTFLGLTTLGWGSFAVLWVVQVTIVSFGMAMVRDFVAFAGPLVLITMLGVALWVFAEAGFTIAWHNGAPAHGFAMWEKIFAGAILWVVIYGTFALNFCDFTRCVGKKRTIVIGNFAGILLNMMLFALIVVLLTGAQFHIDGRIVKSPADIVSTINSTGWRVAVSLVLVVLTVAVNLVANFVAPIYMLSDLAPRVLNFRRAGLVAAIIGTVILPWNLYNSPVAIEFFLGGLGAILGPFFGLIMTDYWLVRRKRVNIPHLYSEAPDATYHYKGGFNLTAFYALVPAAAVAFVLSILPYEVAHFSWVIGALLASGLYYAFVPRDQHYEFVDGESIGRPSQ